MSRRLNWMRKPKVLSGNTHSMARAGDPNMLTCHECQSTFNGEHPNARKVHEQKAVHVVAATALKMDAKGYMKALGFHNCIARANTSLLERAIGIVHPNTGEATATYWAPKWVVVLAARREVAIGARVQLITAFVKSPDLQTELMVRGAFGEKTTEWLLSLGLVPEVRFYDRAILNERKRRRRAKREPDMSAEGE